MATTSLGGAAARAQMANSTARRPARRPARGFGIFFHDTVPRPRQRPSTSTTPRPPVFTLTRYPSTKSAAPVQIPSPYEFPVEGHPDTNLMREIRWYL